MNYMMQSWRIVMKLQNEIEMVHFMLGMAETLFNNQDKICEMDVDFLDGKNLSVLLSDDNVYVKWRPSYGGERHTVFSFDASDYVNVMANGCWTFNFHENDGDFGHKYSVINSLDEELQDLEEFFDAMCENGREITEEEYFQAAIAHPDMPSTYEDTLLILSTLREGRKYNLKNVSVAMYFSEHITMKLLRMIRRQIMFKMGIEFL